MPCWIAITFAIPTPLLLDSSTHPPYLPTTPSALPMAATILTMPNASPATPTPFPSASSTALMPLMTNGTVHAYVPATTTSAAPATSASFQLCARAMAPAVTMRAREVMRLESFSPVPRRRVLAVWVRRKAGRPGGMRSRVETGRERRVWR